MNHKKHKLVIDDFLQYMNQKTNDYILKGGTSLMECYGLDRMSEDIDLDSTNKNTISTIVDSFCKERGYTYNVNKDTDTVKRYMIHYDPDEDLTRNAKPLKVEISYRKRIIAQEDYCIKNGIAVYNIDQIAIMKENAFSQRDKLRDLYDIVFICKNYKNQLPKPVINMIQNGFEHKGLEYFDYITQTQQDDLIDTDKLANDLLDVFDDFGLITNEASVVIRMEQVWNAYFALPKQVRDGIEWNGKKLCPAVFEDMYLAQCEKESRDPDQKISDHFWKNCVEMQGYEPQYYMPDAPDHERE